MRYSLFILVTCLFSFPKLWAQQTKLQIEGHIEDAETKKGVPFATVSLLHSAIGSAANEAGIFTLKFEPSAGDTLLFSSIGYSPLKISFKQFKNRQTVFLQSAVDELPELMVKSQTGLEILQEAIRRIPQNYDTSTVGYTGFYRENVWLGEVELSLIESVVDIYRPFKTDKKPNDQFRILKGRNKQLDFSADPQLYYWLRGTSNGIRGSLAEDMIKYYKTNKYSPLNQANFQYYKYEHVETVNDGQRRLIVLDVVPKGKKGVIQMRLYIEENSFAIVKYNFELTEKGKSLASRKDKHIGYTIMSKVVHASLEYHQFQYELSYKEYAGKWYLNRVTRQWKIFVDSKRRNWDNHLWRADMNLIMTNIDRTPTPITEGNLGASTVPLITLIGDNFKDDFWEGYNFMKGTDSAIMKNDSSDNHADTSIIASHYSNRKNGFTRADTLRGKLNPSRSCYDVTFYHLDVSIDINRHLIKGSNVIRFNVKHPFRRLQFDLHANMRIDKVVFDDKELAFTREFNAVYVDFPQEINPGPEKFIKVYYEGTPKEPDFSIPMDGGALWERDSLGNVWAQMVCQGSGASLWWPNKDHLSDEPDSMKIWVTVPADYSEISNGKLVRKTILPNEQMRYEWEVSYPINNYNVTYNIGKYVHWGGKHGDNDTLDLNFYALPEHLHLAKALFATVPEQLKIFQKNFGKYPFHRDGFTLVESIYPMEHQSGVCVGKLSTSIVEATRLMWHESAHEWWGNAVSCGDMADLWIHEAFATYAEIMMIEEKYGNVEVGVMLSDQRNSIIGEEPVVGISDVNHIHYNISDMYTKGSLMLHTLRKVIDDDNKWKRLLIDIQNHFRFRTTNTTDFISYINSNLKKDYSWFFQRYLFSTSLPSLTVSLHETERNLIVKYKWENVRDFPMRVKITKKVDEFEWISPTSQWQTIILKNMTLDDFEVDEENFLINVTYDSN
jgi:hypothetical protein